MIKCPNCNRFLKDGTPKCTNCGEELPVPEPMEEAVEAVSASAPPEEEQAAPQAEPAEEAAQADEPGEQTDAEKAQEAVNEAVEGASEAIKDGAEAIAKNVNLGGVDFNQIKDYFMKGLETFKHNPAVSAGFFALLFLTPFILGFIPFLGWILALFWNVVVMILAPSYFIYCMKFIKTGNAAPGDMVLGLKYVVNIAIAGIIMGIATGIGFTLLVVPGIFLTGCFLFTFPLIYDRKMAFMDAIKTSFEKAKGKWLFFFMFAFALMIVNAIGALLLGLGVLVTLPVSFGAVTYLYNDVFGIESAEF